MYSSKVNLGHRINLSVVEQYMPITLLDQIDDLTAALLGRERKASKAFKGF